MSQAWPEDALEMVANKFLEEVDMAHEVRKECVYMCKYFHESVRKLSDRWVCYNLFMIGNKKGFKSTFRLSFVIQNQKGSIHSLSSFVFPQLLRFSQTPKLRHANVISWTHHDVQETLGHQKTRNNDTQTALRHRSGEVGLRFLPSICHATGAQWSATRAHQDFGRDGKADDKNWTGHCWSWS